MITIKKLAAALTLAGLTALSLAPAPASAWGYADAYWAQQSAYDNVYNNYSNYQLGQYQYVDTNGYSYYGYDNSGGSNWSDNSGNFYQMDSYAPPDYSNDYYAASSYDSGSDY